MWFLTILRTFCVIRYGSQIMRRLLGYTLILLFTILILAIVVAVVVLLQTVDPEQYKPEVETFSFADTLANYAYDLDSLKAIIGKNKGLPEGFELAAAIAYSAYPQPKELM